MRLQQDSTNHVSPKAKNNNVFLCTFLPCRYIGHFNVPHLSNFLIILLQPSRLFIFRHKKKYRIGIKYNISIKQIGMMVDKECRG